MDQGDSKYIVGPELILKGPAFPVAFVVGQTAVFDLGVVVAEEVGDGSDDRAPVGLKGLDHRCRS